MVNYDLPAYIARDHTENPTKRLAQHDAFTALEEVAMEKLPPAYRLMNPRVYSTDANELCDFEVNHFCWARKYIALQDKFFNHFMNGVVDENYRNNLDYVPEVAKPKPRMTARSPFSTNRPNLRVDEDKTAMYSLIDLLNFLMTCAPPVHSAKKSLVAEEAVYAGNWWYKGMITVGALMLKVQNFG